MARIDGEIVIERPVEEVFDVVADERNEPRFNPRMTRAEKISDGPIGQGTRYRAEVAMKGRSMGMVTELTAYDRPRRLESTTRMAVMDINGTLTFDPVPAGTLMRWSWELRPRGVLRALTPLLARIGRRQEREIWTGLKCLLEEQRPGGR